MDSKGNWSAYQDDVNEKDRRAIIANEPRYALSIGEKFMLKGEQFYVRKITKKDVIIRSVRCTQGDDT